MQNSLLVQHPWFQPPVCSPGDHQLVSQNTRARRILVHDTMSPLSKGAFRPRKEETRAARTPVVQPGLPLPRAALWFCLLMRHSLPSRARSISLGDQNKAPQTGGGGPGGASNNKVQQKCTFSLLWRPEVWDQGVEGRGLGSSCSLFLLGS